MAKGLNRLNLCVTIPDRIVDFWTRPRPLATHQSGPLAATCCTVPCSVPTVHTSTGSPVPVLGGVSACWLVNGSSQVQRRRRRTRGKSHRGCHTPTPLLFLWAPRRLDAPRQSSSSPPFAQLARWPPYSPSPTLSGPTVGSPLSKASHDDAVPVKASHGPLPVPRSSSLPAPRSCSTTPSPSYSPSILPHMQTRHTCPRIRPAAQHSTCLLLLPLIASHRITLHQTLSPQVALHSTRRNEKATIDSDKRGQLGSFPDASFQP
ncbi:hypothetical protein BGZ61DRAFT_23482 [Ilyonectria robusta]|uniref:uncharacterized protein n=1 Tax=Ilyonectria robusta TaxID=1079257 RepID=UPI001E8CF695|nr:uncharacterized protein BGZ61DRAFT_23482 [Ilyonectria robusta]KAH8737833.1 hypothetical protein BGZ61DRAFT_23482 [Ilyonectria robusta]